MSRQRLLAILLLIVSVTAVAWSVPWFLENSYRPSTAFLHRDQQDNASYQVLERKRYFFVPGAEIRVRDISKSEFKELLATGVSISAMLPRD